MPATEQTAELAAFHQYVGERLRTGEPTPSPEEVLVEWELQNQAARREKAVSMVQQALDEIDAGDVSISVDAHLQETRQLLEKLSRQ